MIFWSLFRTYLNKDLVGSVLFRTHLCLFVQQGNESLNSVFVLVYVPAISCISNYSIVIRLGMSMLRRSTCFVCMISGSRGVNIILGHFLYQPKETTCMNLEFEKSSIFFLLKTFYFFQHFVIIYVLFYITFQHLIETYERFCFLRFN